jgi:hypothetical protein
VTYLPARGLWIIRVVRPPMVLHGPCRLAT